MGTIHTPDICPHCGSRIQPQKKGDFFGYCSWDCLQKTRKEYEQQDIAKERTSNRLFGKSKML